MTVPPEALRLLLVGDDDEDAELFAATLSAAGADLAVRFAIERTRTWREANERLTDSDIDLVVLALPLPDAKGFGGLDAFPVQPTDVPVVVLIGPDDEELGRYAVRTGAQDYLVKAHDQGHVLASRLTFAAQRHELQRARDAAQRLLQDRARQLELADRELIAATRLREQLIDIVSHELRTPLTPIIGFAQLLLRRHGDERDDEYTMLSGIERNALRLLARVDDLLCIGQARDGCLHARPRSVSLREVIEAATSALPVVADVLAVTGEVDREVLVDPGHLEQILKNLLSNAVRYGRPPLEIDAVVAAGELVVDIRDHGEGLADEFLHEMWEPFARSEPPSLQTQAGVGLGLAVVRLLAAANGLHVGYLCGDPSVFQLRLPLAGGSRDGVGSSHSEEGSVDLDVEQEAEPPAPPVTAT